MAQTKKIQAMAKKFEEIRKVSKILTIILTLMQMTQQLETRPTKKVVFKMIQ